MIQSDFGRPLVLADLDRWAAEQPSGLLGKTPRLSYRVRAALRKAAEDGYLTWPTAHGPVPKAWAEWCAANRHPPVVRSPRQAYACVDCFLGRFFPDAVHLPPHSCGEIDRLLRPFAVQKGRGVASVTKRGAICDGVTIEESRECAMLMVDLLGERLIWEGP